MKTSEVLNRAADLIEERGHTSGKGWNHEAGGPLCLEGAILAAIGGLFYAFDHYGCPAYKAVRNYLSTRTPHAPWLWNDRLATERVMDRIHRGDVTVDNLDSARAEAAEWAKTEVIATLRAAALIEAAKEAEACALALGVAADAAPAEVETKRCANCRGEGQRLHGWAICPRACETCGGTGRVPVAADAAVVSA